MASDNHKRDWLRISRTDLDKWIAEFGNMRLTINLIRSAGSDPEPKSCHVRPAKQDAHVSPCFCCGMGLLLASHAKESHLRVLLKPCVNLSIHTASDVRPPTL